MNALVPIQIIYAAFEYLCIFEWIGIVIVVLLLVRFPIAAGLPAERGRNN